MLFMQRMLFLTFIGCCLQTVICAQSFEKTTKAKLEEDIKYLVRTIENVHPNPYHSISKERFYQIRDSILHSYPDSLAVVDAWEGLAYLVASINEGHSDLRLPNEIGAALDDGSILLFPVLISQFTKDGLLVRADLSPDSVLHRGDVLLAINDIQVDVIVDRLCLTKGGLRSWRELLSKQDFATQLFMHGIRAPYKITYKQAGVITNKTIEALTKEKLIAALMALRKNNPAPPTEPYRFTRIDNNIGYLDFRSMSTPYEPFNKFLEDTFRSIKQNPINGLIIDLRRNGGGNSALGYRLITYITDKAFRMGAGSKWKVSEEYRTSKNSYLTTAANGDSYVKKFLSMKEGEVLTMDSEAEKPGKNSLRYEGKVCVLIGPNTFSSANMTANAIQDYNLATLIGEPTGEPANDYGELYEGVLPNTKIKFVTSSKMFVRANGDAADKNPVLPHITIKQSTSGDKDDVLDFAVTWIKAN